MNILPTMGGLVKVHRQSRRKIFDDLRIYRAGCQGESPKSLCRHGAGETRRYVDKGQLRE